MQRTPPTAPSRRGPRSSEAGMGCYPRPTGVGTCGGSRRAARWRGTTILSCARPTPLAGPREPIATGGPPAHREVHRGRCLRATRPRSAVPRPAQPRGRPHGMLPLLDHHRGRQPMGVFSATAGPLGPRHRRGHPPQSLPLAVRRRRPTLAVPPPVLGPGHNAGRGGPTAGAPLGPGPPPSSPPRPPRPSGLDPGAAA